MYILGHWGSTALPCAKSLEGNWSFVVFGKHLDYVRRLSVTVFSSSSGLLHGMHEGCREVSYRFLHLGVLKSCKVVNQ